MTDDDFRDVLKARRYQDMIYRHWWARGERLWIVPGMVITIPLVVAMMSGYNPVSTGQDGETALRLFTWVWLSLMAVNTLAIFAKYVIDARADTKIPDEREPELVALGKAGDPDAAFEMAARSKRKGSDWWWRDWIERAAQNGHVRAAEIFRRQVREGQGR